MNACVALEISRLTSPGGHQEDEEKVLFVGRMCWIERSQGLIFLLKCQVSQKA